MATNDRRVAMRAIVIVLFSLLGFLPVGYSFRSIIVKPPPTNGSPLSARPKAMDINDPANTHRLQSAEPLLQRNKIVLFMNGHHHNPKCGFCKAACLLLDSFGEPYTTVNMLAASDSLRESVRKLSGSPVIPQLFVDKHCVGDVEHMLHSFRIGELSVKLKGIPGKGIRRRGKSKS